MMHIKLLKMRDFANANWVVIINTCAVFAFVCTTFLQWHSLRETIRVTSEASSALMATAMLDRWNDMPAMREIEREISSKTFRVTSEEFSNGPGFGWANLNAYLNFYEELGFFSSQGVIGVDTVSSLFGASVIRAYLNGEVRDYVNSVRVTTGQDRAFSEFQELAETLMETSQYDRLIDTHKEDYVYW